MIGTEADSSGPKAHPEEAPASPERRISVALLTRIKGERVTGIEPAPPAWKAGALPLSYTRVIAQYVAIRVDGTRFGCRDSHRLRQPAAIRGSTLPFNLDPVSAGCCRATGRRSRQRCSGRSRRRPAPRPPLDGALGRSYVARIRARRRRRAPGTRGRAARFIERERCRRVVDGRSLAARRLSLRRFPCCDHDRPSPSRPLTVSEFCRAFLVSLWRVAFVRSVTPGRGSAGVIRQALAV